MQQLVEGLGFGLLILDGPPRHQWYRRILIEDHPSRVHGVVGEGVSRSPREAHVLTDWVAWHDRYSGPPEYRLYSGDMGCNVPTEAPPSFTYLGELGRVEEAIRRAMQADVMCAA
jgi:hypothetical protein